MHYSNYLNLQHYAVNDMPENFSSPNTDNAEHYIFWVKLAAIAASATALLLVVIKLYAWFVTDASSMLASATDSTLDLLASVSSVLILRYALAPADEAHRFGHGKAESLAGLAQSAFVVGSAFILIIHGIGSLHNPKVIEQSEVGIWVSIIAIILTLALVVFQKWVIKRTQSLAISADALHYQSDLLLNLGVLAALFLSKGAFVYADGIFTILVGGFLAWSAGKIIWVSVQHLMDRELEEAELKKIQGLVLSHEQALGMHDLRTRRAGPHRFIQFHLELDDSLLLLEAHSISDEIENLITQEFSPCEVFIHQDPSSIVEQ